MECPQCGLINPAGAAQCDCGYWFKRPPFRCSRCGAEAGAGNRFCEACGTALGAAAPTAHHAHSDPYASTQISTAAIQQARTTVRGPGSVWKTHGLWRVPMLLMFAGGLLGIGGLLCIFIITAIAGVPIIIIATVVLLATPFAALFPYYRGCCPYCGTTAHAGAPGVVMQCPACQHYHVHRNGRLERTD